MNDHGLIAGISDQLYHNDTTSLSSTGARKLLTCPARFKWERDNPPPSKPAYDIGRVAHKLVLGEGSPIAVVEAFDWRTKAAQEERKEAYANGHIPVLRSDYDAARAMRDSVFRHPVARELFKDGIAEASGYWRDEPTDIRLKFRPDFLRNDGVCVDLKTTISAEPTDFTRSIAKWGYHFQAAWYLAGLKAHAIDNPRLLFVAVEKSAPYPVSVIELDDEAIAEGRAMMRRAIDRYAKCMEDSEWPAYGDDIVTVSLPLWALESLEVEVG